jgi:cytochrome c553
MLIFSRASAALASALTALVAVATVTAAGAQRSTADTTPSLLKPSLSGMENFAWYCAPCHGHDGKGRGPVAGALTTLPSDLTTLSARNKGVFPAARVRAFITSGDNAVPAHGSRTMPVWGPTFRAFDSSDTRVAVRIANLVTYLESIQP